MGDGEPSPRTSPRKKPKTRVKATASPKNKAGGKPAIKPPAARKQGLLKGQLAMTVDMREAHRIREAEEEQLLEKAANLQGKEKG